MEFEVIRDPETNEITGMKQVGGFYKASIILKYVYTGIIVLSLIGIIIAALTLDFSHLFDPFQF